jgi:hypothetical protein
MSGLNLSAMVSGWFIGSTPNLTVSCSAAVPGVCTAILPNIAAPINDITKLLFFI